VAGRLFLLAVLTAGLSVGSTAAATAGYVQRIHAVERLLEAARADDEPGMWAALSRVSRRRLGPTLVDFRQRGARGVRSSLEPLTEGPYRMIVNQQVDRRLAVVALARRGAYAAFAAPVRLEHGAWKVEIDPVFTIEAVRPLPEERVRKRTQLFAEVAAPGRLDGAAMWLDGFPFDARLYWSRDGKRMSMWGEAPQPLTKGRHTVVAFASAGPEAAANAWVFTVTVPGKR
jgi:hypothetical protein